MKTLLDDIGTLKGCLSIMNNLGFIKKFNIPYDVIFFELSNKNDFSKNFVLIIFKIISKI